MKNKPFILITGDDSVRAEGSILVKRVVEKFADYRIIATKEQQSAVGAKINLKNGGNWGTEQVDGVEAIWVDGTPGDSVYFAFDYLKKIGKKPDLVISGMNLGPNFSDGSLLISGTVCAASIAALSRHTPAIAFSFYDSGKNWLKDHDGEFDEKMLEYPGEVMKKFIIVVCSLIIIIIMLPTLLTVNFERTLLQSTFYKTILERNNAYERFLQTDPNFFNGIFKNLSGGSETGKDAEAGTAQIISVIKKISPEALQNAIESALDNIFVGVISEGGETIDINLSEIKSSIISEEFSPNI